MRREWLAMLACFICQHAVFTSIAAPDFKKETWFNEKHNLGLDFPNVSKICITSITSTLILSTRTGADLRILRWGWGLGRNSSRGMVGSSKRQVRGNFHILTSKKPRGGGVTPLTPPHPPPPWIRHRHNIQSIVMLVSKTLTFRENRYMFK